MFASGAQHELSFIAESTFGVTPDTPAMKIFRNTSVGLKVGKETFVSNEIRKDRQIRDMRHGTKSATGPVAFELSYGDFDTILEAALFSSWSSNVMKVGTTAKSLTLERRLDDVGKSQVFRGCMVNTFSLNIAPNAMVTGEFGIIGKAMTPTDTTLGVPTAVADNPPFDAFTGAILEAGTPVTSITSLSLSLANGLNAAFVIGSDTTPQIIPGRANLTGSITAFFETEALLNKFLNESESNITVTLEGAAGGDLTISIPRIKFTDGDMPVSSSDEGIVVTMPFQALRDNSEATNLKLTRTPA